MIKKIVWGTLFVVFVGVLTLGAVNRTASKTEQVAGVTERGRGQEHPLIEDAYQGQGRGRSEALSATRSRGGQGSGQEQAEGQGQGTGVRLGDGNGTGTGNGYGTGNGSGNGNGTGNGNGAGNGSGNGNASGLGTGSGEVERRYPNNAENTSERIVVEGTVTQAPAEGVDLLIETADGEQVQVGTGPNYLASQGYVLEMGDEVRAQGYWEDGEFKAAQLTRLGDNASITLRDAQGRPAWSGAGRRAASRTTTH